MAPPSPCAYTVRVSSAAQPAAVVAARPAFAEILKEDAYRRLWLSGLCLSTARWMDLVVLGWLSLQLTGSPFMVGLAAFARSAPMMVLGPWSGVIADRAHRGRVLVATQSAGVVTGLALAVLFGSGRGGYWSLVALEVLFGALWPSISPRDAPRSTPWWAPAAWRPRSRSRPCRCSSPR